jgi:hypothetical protein
MAVVAAVGIAALGWGAEAGGKRGAEDRLTETRAMEYQQTWQGSP